MEPFDIIPKDIFNTIDNICVSFILGVLGIAITIFTVVYSFMENTKSEIRILADKIRSSETKDPVLVSDYQFAQSYMKRMKRINVVLMWIIVGGILLFLYFCICFILDTFALRMIAYVGTASMMFVCVFTLSKYLYDYIKRYKNY